MNSFRIALLGLMLATFAPGGRAEAVKIPAGMLVELELQHHVTPSYLEVNAPVYFRVASDVAVGDQTIIRKGTLVTGKMEQSNERGMVGKSGVMALGVRTTAAVDGTSVPIDMDMTQQGRSRGGAVVGWTIFWGIPGLITKGVNPYIERGAILEATISGTALVDPANASLVEEQTVAPLEMAITGHKFEGSSAKVFEFDIERNKNLKTVSFQLAPSAGPDSPAASLASIELLTVDGTPVPAPVRATTVTANSATFDGWSVVKFLRDGNTDLGFRGTATDGRTFDGSYSLPIKIKKKLKKQKNS
jgi:hypothetical protein